MSDDQAKRPSDSDAELEREIRRERKFSLEEAIGRMAGPGMMKGVSPVTRQRQAEAEIEACLTRDLFDSAGVLPAVLLRQVQASDLLLSNLDEPLAALATHVRRVLDSEYLLKELVRVADAEWGQVFGERPRFDREGRPPQPDDPYTSESVRTKLSQLLEKLAAGRP